MRMPSASFSTAQAVAAAQAGATLISPFVGRIYDWHKKSAGTGWDEAAMRGDNDPGVRSVRTIHAQLKVGGYPTEIMGASFRNAGQILALSGCDLLTISPELLDELASIDGDVERKLIAPPSSGHGAPLREGEFRFALNDDAMAVEKLAEGIRVFAADTRRLETLIEAMA